MGGSQSTEPQSQAELAPASETPVKRPVKRQFTEDDIFNVRHVCPNELMKLMQYVELVLVCYSIYSYFFSSLYPQL